MPNDARSTSRQKRSPAITIKKKQDSASVREALTARSSSTSATVMLAVKGNEASSAAIEMASLVAQRLGADLRAVSIVEPALAYGLPYEHPESTMTLDQNAVSARTQQIKDLLSRSSATDAKLSPDVRIGHVIDGICDASKSAGASLVVVGASPQRRLRHIVSGRRATQLIHRIDAPVLSVVPWMRSLPKSIVVAIDFGAASLHAADLAAQLLGAGGKLTLTHVVPLNLIFPATNPLAAKMRRNAERDLGAIAAKLGERVASGGVVQCRVLEGDPVAELFDFAESEAADLVALGTRSGSTLRRVFVGSVATEIIRASLVSVLVAPPPSTAKQVSLTLELNGTTVVTSRADFAAVLEEFSSAHAGHSASLEEDDRVMGAQRQVSGYRLRGATVDPSSGDVQIMLGSQSDSTVHLTRDIPKVKSVAVTRMPGNETALRIEHGSSATLVIVTGTR